MLRHETVAGVDIAAGQAEAGMTGSVHSDHRTRHNPVCIAFLHWPQATVALCRGRESHLHGILDRQRMAAGDSRAGSQAPAIDDVRHRHLRIGEEPARLQFATTVTTQPAQANCLARDHPFEDRSSPLSRRRSPDDPSDHSISAPVLRLPGRTESYSRPAGQAILRGRCDTEYYLCACPSAVVEASLVRHPVIEGPVERPGSASRRTYRLPAQ